MKDAYFHKGMPILGFHIHVNMGIQDAHIHVNIGITHEGCLFSQRHAYIGFPYSREYRDHI